MAHRKNSTVFAQAAVISTAFAPRTYNRGVSVPGSFRSRLLSGYGDEAHPCEHLDITIGNGCLYVVEDHNSTFFAMIAHVGMDICERQFVSFLDENSSSI